MDLRSGDIGAGRCDKTPGLFLTDQAALTGRAASCSFLLEPPFAMRTQNCARLVLNLLIRITAGKRINPRREWGSLNKAARQQRGQVHSPERACLIKSSIRSIWPANTIQVRAMLAHAVLIGGVDASRAMRPHSFEFARHSNAESMGPSSALYLEPSPSYYSNGSHNRKLFHGELIRRGINSNNLIKPLAIF